MTPPTPTLAEIEARHKQADNWIRNRSLSAIRVHDDRASLLRLVREQQDTLNAIGKDIAEAFPKQTFDPGDIANHVRQVICGHALLYEALEHSKTTVRERDAEIANQRAEWATAMADIVRLREALRQWQLGVGDTEIELALKERDARLAEIAREVEDNMPPRGVKTPVTAIRETLRRIYNIAKGDAA